MPNNSMINAKQLAAHKAVTYVKQGMVVGLGTGTTAYYAIEKLGGLVKEGLEIGAVCSSIATENLAGEYGIPLLSFNTLSGVDLYIDGADEVDAAGNLIKGGGGALVREKILAASSKQFIVIVDASKQTAQLGHFAVPVEVVPFATEFTLLKLQAFTPHATLRQKEGALFVSDNGNHIIDLSIPAITDVTMLNRQLNEVPGVVESGLFPARLVHTIITGYEDGHFTERVVSTGMGI